MFVFFNLDPQVFINHCLVKNKNKKIQGLLLSLTNHKQRIYLVELSTVVYAIHMHPNIRDLIDFDSGMDVCPRWAALSTTAFHTE